MDKKHKMLKLASVLALAITLSWAMGKAAASGSQAGYEFVATPAREASTGGEIIPPDRRIDWSYGGIPGGIPERKTVCATIDSGVYGNGVTDATEAIQDAIDSCPDRQVVYVPEGTYITSDTIHLYRARVDAGAARSMHAYDATRRTR